MLIKKAGSLLIAVLITLCLSCCSHAVYPEYEAVENSDLGAVELHYNGVIYRPYGISDKKCRGKKIGIREGEPDIKICEVNGYDSDEWIVEYLDVFMSGGDMLFKAEGITEIPEELEQYKEYDY